VGAEEQCGNRAKAEGHDWIIEGCGVDPEVELDLNPDGLVTNGLGAIGA
jgi:hypothetical protein